MSIPQSIYPFGYIPGRTADVRAPDHLQPSIGTVINLSAEDYDARITI